MTEPLERPATGAAELRDPHRSVGFARYLGEVRDRRQYIHYVALQELRSRQATNVLGNLWHLLNPVLAIGVYYVVFGLLLKVDRGVDDFLLFLTVGLFVFQFTQKVTIEGAKSIIANAGLLKAIRFPRAILPISSTYAEFIAALPTFALMFLILLSGGQAPQASWLLFPLVIACQLAFNLGSALIAARLTTHFRDTTQILPFFFRLLLYGSGVIYSVDAYVQDNPSVKLLFVLNPMYCYLTIARWTIFGGSLDGAVILSAAIWTVGILIVGFVWFRAGEERYARD